MLKITQYNPKTHQYEATIQPQFNQLENFDRYDLIDQKFENHDLNNLLSRNNLYTTDWTHFNINQHPVFYGDLLIAQSNDEYGTYLLMPYLHPRKYQLTFSVLYHEGPDNYFNNTQIVVEDLKNAYKAHLQYQQLDQDTIINHDYQGLKTILTNQNIITLTNDHVLDQLATQYQFHSQYAKQAIHNLVDYLPHDLTWQPLSQSLKTKLKTL